MRNWKIFRSIRRALGRLKFWQKPKPTPTIPPKDYTPHIPATSYTKMDYSKPPWGEIAKKMKLDPDRVLEVKRVCRTILTNRARYMRVEGFTGVPWWVVAAYHYRESSLSFKGVLHNGQEIIGTGRRTTWQPKGRGPFGSWEEAAIDALKMKGYNEKMDWSIPGALEKAERYNGLGYRKRRGDKGKVELSPYIAAGTNFHDETSKYVADGRYDDDAPEKQLGVAAIWLGLGIFDKWDKYEYRTVNNG